MNHLKIINASRGLVHEYENAKMKLFNCNADVNKKVQLDATICRHLFTAESLYMFRASQHPSSGALKTVTATSGKGHYTGTATSFQRGLLRTTSCVLTVNFNSNYISQTQRG